MVDELHLAVEPMKYHGPGWSVEGPTRMVIDPDDGNEYEGADCFQLWAPNEERDHWLAAWTPTADNLNLADGFFVTRATMDEALAPFDRPDIKQYGEALRRAAEAAQVSR